MDYQLDGLSPRSFEHLVQALAVSAITTTITPFGDGPDGMREATFDGQTSYGSLSMPWLGRGIVQAKFHQRTRTSGIDGKWALRELRKELQRLRARCAAGDSLKYYIFATNVVLTPAPKTGTKDKAIALLSSFANEVGLTDFDIWDYDKIRILLENNESVRTAYSAWITPGDVLYALAERLKPRRRDYHKLMVNFLQKELLSDQFARLEQAGHSADEAIPLSQVFVDLPSSNTPATDADGEINRHLVDERGFAARMIDASGQSCRTSLLNPVRKDPKGIPQRGRYVLIGGPGQGKTTVGQYICQIFRSALLQDVDATVLDPEVIKTVAAIRAQWVSGSIPNPEARRFPIRVVLSEYAAALAESDAAGMLDYIAKQFSRRVNVDVTPQEIQDVLVEYPLALILDGLDEVPPSTNRQEVLASIRDFWVDVSSSDIDAIVIATSRPQGYNEEFSPDLYEHQWLVPLSPDRALEYGSKLTQVRFGTDPTRVMKVLERLERAIQSQATARLMRSPLQVTILTLLVDRMGQPPQERWALFKEYYNLIYQREIERDIPAALVLREYRPDIDTIHRRVGLLLQVESEKSGGTDASLTTDQFSSVVEQYLREEDHEGRELEDLKASIIEGAAQRLVFLVGLESGQVGFEVRSLQEYMAAEGLMEADDRTTQSRLREIAKSGNWRNVFLFAAGRCFAERRHLRDTIQSICMELNDDPEDRVARSILAGSELALDLLEDGSANKQPGRCRALTRIALRLLDLPSRNGPSRLASVYQRCAEDIFADELLLRIRSDDGYIRAGAFDCLVSLSEDVGGRFEQVVREEFEDNTTVPAELVESLLSSRAAKPDWLRDQLLAQIAARGPMPVIRTVLSRLHRDVPDRMELWSGLAAPVWLESLIAMANARFRHNSGPQFRVMGPNDISVGTASVVSIRDEMNNQAEVPSTPAEDARWEILRAKAEFGNNPCSESLARVIRVARNVKEIELLRWIGYAAPWPLGDVLLTAENSDHLQAFADMAALGELGTLETWLEQEAVWMERGVTLDEMMTVRAATGIDGATLYGFPALAGQIYPSASEEEGFSDAVKALLPLLGHRSPERLRRLTSEFLGFALIDVYRNRLAMPDWGEEVILALVERDHYLAGELIRAYQFTPDISEGWLSLLASPAVVELAFDPSRQYILSQLAYDVWSSTRDMKYLPALALAVQSPKTRVEIRDAFIPKLAEETELQRFARVVVNLRLGVHREPLVEDIQATLGWNKRSLDAMLRALRARRLSNHDEGEELLWLSDIVGGDQTYRVTMYLALRSVYSRTRSRLDDLGVWNSLGFPIQLASVMGARTR